MMTDHQGNDLTMTRSIWIARAPLLLAAAVICLIAGFNLVRPVLADSPRNPWEAIRVLEGWRSVHGMPVYELNPDGHSTHIYGALAPWVQGELFRWLGPNNVSGRFLTLIAALTTVSLLTVTMRGDRSTWYLFLAWALIPGTNHRAAQYFAENRPDLLALMFTTVAMLLMAYAQEKRRVLLMVLGTGCLVLGFFLKQTASVYAAVPVVALILRGKRPSRSEVLFAVFPIAIIAGTILGCCILNPTVYYYMVQIPRGFAISWPRAVRLGWEFLIDSPSFLVLLGEWFVSRERVSSGAPRVLWLFSVLAIAIPFGAVSHAMVGGWFNCFLPALMAMTAFCVLRLPVLLRLLEDRASPLRYRLIFGSFLAVLTLMTTFPRMTRYVIEPTSPYDGGYRRVIALAARLLGTVICPEDPTIPLYAKGRAGQNVYGEKDARPVHGTWPASIPNSVLNEIRGADFVVDVTTANGWDDSISAEDLLQLGFEPADDLEVTLECHRIRRRKSVSDGPLSSRTAPNLPRIPLTLESRSTQPR